MRRCRPRRNGSGCNAGGVARSDQGWKMVRHSVVRHSVPVKLQRPEGKIPFRPLPNRARWQGAANSASCLGDSRSFFACFPGGHACAALKSRNSNGFGAEPTTGLMRMSSNGACHKLNSQSRAPTPRAPPSRTTLSRTMSVHSVPSIEVWRRFRADDTLMWVSRVFHRLHAPALIDSLRGSWTNANKNRRLVPLA